jgi:hypothetical protein
MFPGRDCGAEMPVPENTGYDRHGLEGYLGNVRLKFFKEFGVNPNESYRGKANSIPS